MRLVKLCSLLLLLLQILVLRLIEGYTCGWPRRKGRRWPLLLLLSIGPMLVNLHVALRELGRPAESRRQAWLHAECLRRDAWLVVVACSQ